MDSAWLNPRLWNLTQEAMTAWMLVLVRMSGLMASLPGLSQEGLPVRIRALFAVFAALVIAPVVGRPKALPNDVWGLAGAMATELAAGLLLGMLVAWTLEAVGFAGHLMDLQIGFSFAQILDPGSNQNASLAGVFLLQCATLFIFVSGLHHTMIQALVESYRILPMGSPMPAHTTQLVPMLGHLLAKGLQLAFPVLVTLFLVDVLAGVSSKLMPQLQLFQLTFSIKIGVGLAILAYLLRSFSDWLMPMLQRVPGDALRLLS